MAVELTNPDGTPKINCQNADCDNDEHCFRPNRREWDDPTGDCRYCGDRSVDWERVKRRDMTDSKALRDELRKEWIRNHFWTKEIDEKSVNWLAAKSRDDIRSRLRLELQKCVGPAQPYRDGQRVPVADEKLKGKPFAYAQHATASCCTRCTYYWWGFERNTKYTDEQIDFLTDVCMSFLDDRGVLPGDAVG